MAMTDDNTDEEEKPIENKKKKEGEVNDRPMVNNAKEFKPR
jgi:hypothetical protein